MVSKPENNLPSRFLNPVTTVWPAYYCYVFIMNFVVVSEKMYDRWFALEQKVKELNEQLKESGNSDGTKVNSF